MHLVCHDGPSRLPLSALFLNLFHEGVRALRYFAQHGCEFSASRNGRSTGYPGAFTNPLVHLLHFTQNAVPEAA